MAENEIKTAETEKAMPTVEELQKQIASLQADLLKQKKSTDSAASDASEWKKKFRETQSEQERLEAERAERDAQRDAELKAYKDRDRMFNYKTKLMEVGYDANTAAAMATDLPEGIGDSFFSAQKQFLETQRQNAEAEALRKQPTLTKGNPPASQSMEETIMSAFRKSAGLTK